MEWNCSWFAICWCHCLCFCEVFSTSNCVFYATIHILKPSYYIILAARAYVEFQKNKKEKKMKKIKQKVIICCLIFLYKKFSRKAKLFIFLYGITSCFLYLPGLDPVILSLVSLSIVFFCNLGSILLPRESHP